MRRCNVDRVCVLSNRNEAGGAGGSWRAARGGGVRRDSAPPHAASGWMPRDAERTRSPTPALRCRGGAPDATDAHGRASMPATRSIPADVGSTPARASRDADGAMTAVPADTARGRDGADPIVRPPGDPGGRDLPGRHLVAADRPDERRADAGDQLARSGRRSSTAWRRTRRATSSTPPTSAAAIYGYRVNRADGSLAALAGLPLMIGGQAITAAIDPQGRFLYVGNSGDNSLYAYRIDADSGALNPVTGSPFVLGATPAGVCFHPSGRVRVRVVGCVVGDDSGWDPGLQRRADVRRADRDRRLAIRDVGLRRRAGRAPERQLPVRRLLRCARAGDRSDDARRARARRFAARRRAVGQLGHRSRRRSARAVLSTPAATRARSRPIDSMRRRRVRPGRGLAVST